MGPRSTPPPSQSAAGGLDPLQHHLATLVSTGQEQDHHTLRKPPDRLVIQRKMLLEGIGIRMSQQCIEQRLQIDDGCRVSPRPDRALRIFQNDPGFVAHVLRAQSRQSA